MKAVLLTLAAVLVTSLANADVIKCTFTEPFIDTEYSMTKQTLTYTVNKVFSEDGVHNDVTIITNVSFQIKAPGLFELVSADKKVLQTLTLNGKGSNGMSETIYPYSVKDNSPLMTANAGIGGCSSNYLKTTLPKE